MTYEAPSAQPDQSHECYIDRSERAVRRPATELNDTGSIWTDALQTRLRELWAQGLTASQIAAELCITRNAVIGKAHRLGLSGRASPIQRSKAPKLTLVALKERMCKWPIGHPGEPDFHFCGGEARPSSPYCLEHHVMAYICHLRKRGVCSGLLPPWCASAAAWIHSQALRPPNRGALLRRRHGRG
jgi:GcrA cell cycle regulator